MDRRTRVLLVDDGTGRVDDVADALERTDERIEVATTTAAREALEHLSDPGSEVDCVLLCEAPSASADDGTAVVEGAETGDATSQDPGRLAQYQELIRALSTTFPDYAFVMSAEGEYLEVFTGWQSNYEWYTEEELLGRNHADILPGETVDRIDRAIEAALEDEELQTIEYPIRTPGGTYWYEGHVAPLADGYEGEPAVVLSTRDVTERRERERKLERQNERLEEFANVVSHDLRNPIEVARARVERGRLGADPDDPVQNRFDEIEAALERMGGLVDSLLTLAREGQPIEKTRQVSMATIATESWEMVDAPAAEFDVAGDCTVRADPDRLRQLLENLFANAVEHAGPDVTVTAGPIEGGFYVADDGPGIPRDRRERVFEVGYSTGEGGNGYGLSIVRRIAQAHGWTVDVTDAAGGGARFEFRGVEDY